MIKIITMAVLFLSIHLSGQTLNSDISRLITGLPFSMPDIGMPKIPAYEISIVDAGAIGDGQTMNSEKFSMAINTCVQKGGGKVVVPPGMWLTGPIKMESNVELHLEEGAVILFSKKFEDYPMYQRPKSSSYKCSPMVSGTGLHDIAITGKGILNGNGQYWRPVKKEKLTEKQWKELVRSGGVVSADGKLWFPSSEAMNGETYLRNLRKEKKEPTAQEYSEAREYLRPVMVEFVNCTNVLFEDATFTNSPAWTISPVQCDNVVIKSITVRNPWWGQNTDGVDINACHNVIMYNSTVDVGDDAICLKPGTAGSLKKGEPSCRNIVIADCKIYHGHGGFVIGSESYGGAENVYVKNLSMFETDIGLRFKSAAGRGGEIKNIDIDGVQMNDIAGEAVLFDLSYGGDTTIDVSDRTRIPDFHDFSIKNIICNGASHAIVIRGMDGTPVTAVRFDSLVINSVRGCELNDVENISVANSNFTVQKGSLFEVSNGENIRIENVTYSKDTELFLKASGKKTKQIYLIHTDPSHAARDFEISPDVPMDPILKK